MVNVATVVGFVDVADVVGFVLVPVETPVDVFEVAEVAVLVGLVVLEVLWTEVWDVTVVYGGSTTLLL